MDRKQQLLIRNIVAGILLLVVLLVLASWAGLFESAGSDDAQIRELMEKAREEVNDHDYDDFLKLCDLTDERREAWLFEIRAQPMSNFVVVDTLAPKGFIAVPSGASEYSVDVHTVSGVDVPFRGRVGTDSINGTMYFVKKNDRWYIDLEKSASTFPYVPRPKQ